MESLENLKNKNVGSTDFPSPAENIQASGDILRRVARQEKQSVENCLDKYGKLVWSMARRYTRTTEDAEDAVQDIFIDIWRYAARFDESKSPELAFITLIARRRLIDRLRKSNAQPQISLDEYASETRQKGAGENLLMFLEVRSAIKQLNKLGARQKQILQMSVYAGMTHQEIARTTGLPLGTIKSQIRRGFQKIREAI